MTTQPSEVTRRTEAGLAAIKATFQSDDEEGDVSLFVSHHLEEMGGDYWQELLGSAQPEPHQVLELLELRSHWSEEDDEGLDQFDFSLPRGATDYLLCVRFDEDGNVESIDMES